MIKGEQVICAHWCLSDNFGDKLTPYIIEKISGKKCIWSHKETDITKYLVTGSILNWDIKRAIVWGCGLADKSDNVIMTDVIAVRGEISKYIALLSGIIPVAIGDPALLLPRIYKPEATKKYALGIFPHYTDTDLIAYHLLDNMSEEVIIINPLGNVETIIDNINSCEKIISSSLHGLVVADAYQIPTQWVEFSYRILGDKTKFMDYYSSIKYPIETKPINFESKINIAGLMDVKCSLKELDIDLDKLYNCCPFKP